MENLLVTQAKNGVPFLVPWGKEAVSPGRCFESRGMQASPWLRECPFKDFDPAKTYMGYTAESDARASFRSAESNSHSTSNTHYSASLGATVDAKFASINVTGSYDRNVQENRDVSEGTHPLQNVFK